MKILHTEASLGWGGQEMRILAEAEGMRERGHEIFFAVADGAQLAVKARLKGFEVFEIKLRLKSFIPALYQLCRVIRQHQIQIVNTHSSADAWLGGIASRLMGCKTIRTRHLSTPSKSGINSRMLYHYLADYTVTTCQEVADKIQSQAAIPKKRCRSIPTGVDENKLRVLDGTVEKFKTDHGISEKDVVIGTTCILRSWKGISDLLKAAKILENYSHVKWLIVGDGPCKESYIEEARSYGLENRVLFTGQLSPPYTAIAAMDVFVLLSTANEGVSQASLQAAYLQKPLVTTTVGGLPEVAIEGETGYNVPPRQPEKVAKALEKLLQDSELRRDMGLKAHHLVSAKFTMKKTLGEMEAVYSEVL